MRNRRFAVDAAMLVGLLCAVVLVSAPTFGQTASKPDRAAIERGKASFKESCAACHGETGRGNGPAAGAMKQRPTNLAVIARERKGFPASEIQASIKGTSPVVAHGAPGMMVWGALFLADANGNQAKADARINDLVAFIESIQVK